MNLSFDTREGLSLGNVRGCAEASRLAYASPTWTDKVSGEGVFIEDCGNVFVVAYPGTHDLHDVLRDGQVLRRRVVICGKPCEVHRGFDASFAATQSRVVRAIEMYSDGKPLVITGHSKGAAVAKRLLCRLAEREMANRVLCMVTFGEPRGGNGA